MVSGAEYFLDLLDFDGYLAGMDLVITGEGSIDEQTEHGKLLAVLARRAHPVPVIAVAGRNTLSPEPLGTHRFRIHPCPRRLHRPEHGHRPGADRRTPHPHRARHRPQLTSAQRRTTMTLTDVHSPLAADVGAASLLSPRRAKIVCTLGPATATDERTRTLVETGMDIARLNFSHGDHTDHEANYRRVRAAADSTGRAVGILADLQGPKIRLGRFADGGAVWATGEQVRITVEDCAGTHDRVSTTYTHLAQDARPGDRLLVDDGKIALTVARRRRQRRGVPGDRGRPDQQQQGRLPARDERVRPGAVGQGHRRPRIRPAARRRLDRPVVRARPRPTSTGSTR